MAATAVASPEFGPAVVPPKLGPAFASLEVAPVVTTADAMPDTSADASTTRCHTSTAGSHRGV